MTRELVSEMAAARSGSAARRCWMRPSRTRRSTPPRGWTPPRTAAAWRTRRASRPSRLGRRTRASGTAGTAPPQREQRRRERPGTPAAPIEHPRRAREGSRTLRSERPPRPRGARPRCPKGHRDDERGRGERGRPAVDLASSANGAIVPTASGSKAFVFVFESTARPGLAQSIGSPGRRRVPDGSRWPASDPTLHAGDARAPSSPGAHASSSMSPLAVKSDRPSFRISDEFGRSRRAAGLRSSPPIFNGEVDRRRSVCAAALLRRRWRRRTVAAAAY